MTAHTVPLNHGRIGRLASLVCLYLAGVGAAAQIAKIIPVFEHLEAARGLNLPQSTFVMSAIGVTAMGLGLIAGRMVVRLGTWRAITWGLAIAVAAGGLLPFAPSFATIVALRLIEGVGHVAVVTAAPTLMVGVVDSRHAGRVLGLWASFFGVAFAITGLVAATGLNATRPTLFLELPILLFLPALLLGATQAASDDATAPARRDEPTATRGLTVSQRGLAMSFLFHAGVFTSLLAFAQGRIGGDAGIVVAPVLPLVALGFVFVGTALLGRTTSLRLFLIGAALCGGALIAAIPLPLPSYIAAFAGVGLMQAGVFAGIGRVAATDVETSALNGAFAQLGNLGNVVVPFLISLILQGPQGGPIEPALAAAVAVAAAVQWATRKETHLAI